MCKDQTHRCRYGFSMNTFFHFILVFIDISLESSEYTEVLFKYFYEQQFDVIIFCSHQVVLRMAALK